MAVTATVLDSFVGGARAERIVSVLWDSSYLTTGEPITLSSIGIRGSVSYVSPGVARNSSGDVFLVSWNGSTTAPALIASRVDQVDDFGEQVPDTTDLSAFTSRHHIIANRS